MAAPPPSDVDRLFDGHLERGSSLSLQCSWGCGFDLRGCWRATWRGILESEERGAVFHFLEG
jgi:hypothetical protein